ncbi:hypothetical protein [Methylobacter psychrophilus]|uniref:hypothetical protein n=1 Tax=Methylobacter psychrophilus TaxID=96941 RepID=UPI0021D4B972|nr:hypothetical protein [Methylobacter psychrophilus]
MKLTNPFKSTLFIAVILFNGAANAYSPEELDKECKKPRFTDFNLTEYKAPDNIEVAPESEFIIKISPWTNPSTIKLMAKKQPLAFTLESNTSFHKIKAKLPASLNGSYVRIDVSAKAALGCEDKDGWLIKIAK